MSQQYIKEKASKKKTKIIYKEKCMSITLLIKYTSFYFIYLGYALLNFYIKK